MKIIFIGTKNFTFFSKSLLSQYEKVIVTNMNYQVPEFISSDSKIIRINDVYDANSMTFKLDVNECIESLKEIVTHGENVKVFCNQEANLEVAEIIRQNFGVYDHMGGRVEIFRDKVLMKETLERRNLRVPRFTALNQNTSFDEYEILVENLSDRFIIKPSCSVGSRGVYKIFNKSDFNSFINDNPGDLTHFEAEEFINGDLYEFDTVVQNGELIYSNVSRYSCPMADLQEGTTLGSIMVGRDEEIHHRISHFGEQCLKALDALNGCFHMELFHSSSDELVFLEVAARSPGLMTVPAYHRWEGVNMYDLELLVQSGRTVSISDHPPTISFQSRPSFFVVYPKISGTVMSINTPETDAEVDIDWQVSPGLQVEDTTTNIDYAARFFVTCKNAGHAQEIFEWLTKEFKAVNYA
ncbi:hypothetical protein BSU01_24310 [Erwinia billingiae]|uniref:ATP-grasp domain-containing protein n=1 Tax=Erwinia billingiae TaxID=182337 RepID=UPI0019CF5404|nr:ATP-grasp domain-containing protein [Erwinia billingiae]MBN7124794.1 hypothetical protein [Erwinia billingiae]